MKQAILIQCHRNPTQVNLLLDALDDPNLDLYVHVDRKSDIASEIRRGARIHLLPDETRVDVSWASFSLLEATLNLMRYASARGEYGHYLLCSGQDYPLVRASELAAFLNENAQSSFVHLWDSKNHGGRSNNYDKRTDIYYPRAFLGNALHRRIAKRALIELTGGYNRTWPFARRKPPAGVDFYFGSQWVCISGELERWIEDYLQKHPEFIEFYRHTNCPDESFFQTLLMNSPYRNQRQDALHYVDWSLGGNSPKILDASDMDKLLQSDKWLARKFADEAVIGRLAERIRERPRVERRFPAGTRKSYESDEMSV